MIARLLENRSEQGDGLEESILDRDHVITVMADPGRAIMAPPSPNSKR